MENNGRQNVFLEIEDSRWWYNAVDDEPMYSDDWTHKHLTVLWGSEKNITMADRNHDVSDTICIFSPGKKKQPTFNLIQWQYKSHIHYGFPSYLNLLRWLVDFRNFIFISIGPKMKTLQRFRVNLLEELHYNSLLIPTDNCSQAICRSRHKLDVLSCFKVWLKRG